MGNETEACGRCGMSSVVDAADGEADTGEAIEVADEAARLVSPAAWLGGLRRRLDDAAARLTYDR